MPKLTKRIIDAATPRAGVYAIWCDEPRGFGVRIFPSGRKVFVYRGRLAGGRSARERLMTIGDHGTFTVEQARDSARAFKVAARNGADPAAERERVKNAITVKEFFAIMRRDFAKAHYAQTTLETFDYHVNKRIVPALGDHKIDRLSPADIARFHASGALTPRTANLSLATLAKALSLAEEWHYREKGSNPARDVKKFATRHRERFLSEAELEALGRALMAAEAEGLPWRPVVTGRNAKHLAKPENRKTPVNADVIALIRFLLLTGARLGEACNLKWSDINFDHGTAMLPAVKGGANRAHEISRAALDFLMAKRRDDDHPFIFRADPFRVRRKRVGLDLDAPRPIQKSVVENAWQRIRAAAGLADVHLHDLRHTVGTWASRKGANAYLIRDLLRHSDVSMTQVYVNRDETPLRALSDEIGAAIGPLIGVGNAVSKAKKRTQKKPQ